MRGFLSLFCDNGPEKPCTEDCRLLGTKIATKSAHARNLEGILN